MPSMPPPAPLLCSVPGCTYETPPGAPTWEACITLLTTHAQSVHGAGGTQQATPTGSKLEKLPRPVFTLNMNVSQWSFTVIQWENYIKQSAISPEVKLMQLQAACDDQLRQRVFDTGVYSSLNTAELFLEKMKELAVIVVHKAIHLMNLWKMQQQSDEPIRAFVARLTSTADMCAMIVECTNQTCKKKICYRDQVVHQLIIHGMRHNNIRVRVLSRNTAGELTSLDKLIDYIAAEEAGTAEASDLVSDAHLVGGINRNRSTYTQQKRKCRNCGGPRHTPANSPEDREKLCPAWGKKCEKCNKMHHVAKACKSSISTNASIQASNTEKSDNAADTKAATSAGLFSLESFNQLPCTPSDVPSILNYIRTGEGPVTTLPLPTQIKI